MPSAIQLATPRWRRTRIPTGHAAHPIAIYVTTASQSRRFGIRSQHSGKQERDRSCDPNTYLAHINLPTVFRNRVMRLAQNRKPAHPPGLGNVLAECALGNVHPAAVFAASEFGDAACVFEASPEGPPKGC